MKFSRQAQPTNLAEWLNIAIGQLVPSAQTRINAEIEAHYTEAVTCHQENGLRESAAQAQALVDLGEAKSAGRRFCRKYLTKKEANEFKKSPAGRLNLVGLLCGNPLATFYLCAVMSLNVLPFAWFPYGVMSLQTLLAIFLLILIWGLAQQPLTRAGKRHLVLLASIFNLDFAIFGVIGFASRLPHMPLVIKLMLPFMSWGGIKACFYYFRLHHKLTTDLETSLEPPCDPGTA